MNTPKTFEPVVTEAMRHSGDRQYSPDCSWSDNVESAFRVMIAHFDMQSQLREYAVSVARQMAPGKQDFDSATSAFAAAQIMGHNACRAATLSAIDEWEKNDG